MDLKSIIELTRKGTSFEKIVVPNGVHTVEDVERACQCAKAEVIKTLLFVGKKPVVVLMTGDRRVDVVKLKKARGDDSLRMANRKEVGDITGYAVGAVSPFGLRGETEVIADQDVQALAFLIMGSGKEDTLLKMTQAEFANAFTGIFVPLAL